MTPDEIIRWTARVAMACYLARLLIDAAGGDAARRKRLSRSVWTLGCVIFLAHFVAVFALMHHWSHAAAWEHTRQRTFETTGWNSGAGLILNYVFTAWWACDVVLWWIRDDWPRQRWAQWPLHVFFAFMVFNATVVYGPRGWMIVGAAFAAAMSVVTWRRPRLSPRRLAGGRALE